MLCGHQVHCRISAAWLQRFAPGIPAGSEGGELGVVARGLVVMPASLLGGLLWTLAPQAPFFVAAGVCLIGVMLMVTGRHSRMASAG